MFIPYSKIFHDLDSEIPPIVSVPIAREFVDLFPNDLPDIPLKWEIDFRMYLLPDTNPN